MFDSKEECQKYDDSAKAVLNEKYNKLVLRKTCEYCIFDIGSEDNDAEIVKLNSEEDVDLMKQMYFLYNSYYLDKQYEELPDYVKTDFKDMEDSVKNNDILFVGRGYDRDGFWIYGSTKSLCDKINSYKPKEQKKEPEYGGC